LQAFNNWQSAYDQWQSTYRIRLNPGQVTNFSCRELASLGSQLADTLNNWLNSDFGEWKKIRERLHRSLSETDEIQFIIQTEDMQLRQLPWHLWDCFSEHYTKAEIALSAQQYRPPPPPNPTNRVRILAILGDSTGINLEQDKAILQEQLQNAKITFLTQPQLQVLNHQLWEQQWDILFFAGHSASQEDGSTGQIHINQNDSVSLRDLRNALRKAILGGLQLAIFNSCDGLGLAQEIGDLNIPQLIVMRKPVPDLVAQEFLRHFLRIFASGTSLYLAVREARERLQGLEKEFPCASWLPVICQNPNKKPLTWEDICHTPKGSFDLQNRSIFLNRRILQTGILAIVAITALVMFILLITPELTETVLNRSSSRNRVVQVASPLEEVALQNGNVISLECQGHIRRPGQRFFLDGRTGNGTVALASTTDGSFKGTRWKVHVIDSRNGIIALENQGQLYGSKFLHGNTGDGSVGLAPNTSGLFPGTKWKVRVINSRGKVIVLENQVNISSLKLLNGFTVDGTVDLSSTTDGGFTGTQWKIINPAM
jgi:hypothetical protein